MNTRPTIGHFYEIDVNLDTERLPQDEARRRAFSVARRITKWTDDVPARREVAEALGLLPYQGHDTRKYGSSGGKQQPPIARTRIPAHEDDGGVS